MSRRYTYTPLKHCQLTYYISCNSSTINLLKAPNNKRLRTIFTPIIRKLKIVSMMMMMMMTTTTTTTMMMMMMKAMTMVVMTTKTVMMMTMTKTMAMLLLI